MKITWNKLTRTQWDKACETACAAGRTEVPEALKKARAAKAKKGRA